MAKIGVEISIDVTKIDKARLYQGKKGKYLTMTTFIDLDEQDKYEQNGIIKQKTERDEKVEMPILGGCKIFWESDPKEDYPEPSNEQDKNHEEPDDDIPF